MEKQQYIKPVIDKVTIDNEISVVLMSQPGPETIGGGLDLPDNPEMM